MAAFTDAEYRARELQRDARITRGNALNAAAAFHSGGQSSPGDVLETAAMFEEYLGSAGAVPADPPASTGKQPTLEEATATVVAVANATVEEENIVCPDCGGEVWDNRQKKQAGKYSDKAPDYSCKDRDGCGGAVWPAKKRSPRKRTTPSDRAKKVAASV